MTAISNTGALRQREPRVRDREHLGKVARLPCLPCLIRRGVVVRPVEVAHVKAGWPEAGWRAFGHSEKAHDARTLPMCSSCHRTGPQAQHGNVGGDERRFWENLCVHPPTVCAALVDAFAAGRSGQEVITRYASEARQALAAQRR